MRNWSTLKKLIWQRGALAGGAGYAWATVSGSAPLSLPDAVEKRLKALIQEGRTAQGISPTMTAPQNLICNNGTLQLVDSELPSEYKRIIGMEFSAATYYKISGFHLRGSDTVRISFSVDRACNVFGCYTDNAATDNYSLYMSTTSNAKYLRYDGDVYNSYIPSAQFGTRYDVVITPNGTTGMPDDSTITPATFESVAELCVGTTSISASSSKLDGCIWGNFEIDGRLKLIPCERTSDNVLGYYDTVDGTFYEPIGSSPVSIGYDASHLNVLTVVGTPEVLSLGTQTASVVSLFSGASTSYPDLQDVVSGEVTRNVGIKVFDGTEDGFTAESGTVYYAGLANANASNDAMLSTHFTPLRSGSTPVSGKHMTFDSGRVVFYASKTADEFKAWLAEQYAAGTPVILLYQLATPVTEQVPAQTLVTAEGSNTVALTKVLSFQVNLTATYAKAVSEG